METPRSVRYPPDPNIADAAALIGHPTRAAVLIALLDGRALPASALAWRGAASPQAASAHLRKLVDGGLLRVRVSGRHRLYQLATREVARALEALLAIAAQPRIVALSQSLAMQRLRDARVCYDHLAGRLGVAVTDALVARGVVRVVDGEFHLTPKGERFFDGLGVDVAGLRHRRRPLVRTCMDWTERRPHLAGSLGMALQECFVANAWIERRSEDRAVRLTERGRRTMTRVFGMRAPRAHDRLRVTQSGAGRRTSTCFSSSSKSRRGPSAGTTTCATRNG
jgi:DNA-binding transcriptional ArsR family regulator